MANVALILFKSVAYFNQSSGIRIRDRKFYWIGIRVWLESVLEQEFGYFISDSTALQFQLIYNCDPQYYIFYIISSPYIT